MHDPSQAFRDAILTTLGHAPDVIEPGRFLRFGTSDRRGDDAGWCKLFDDLRGGVFGCYRQGISETWCAVDRATMTREQRAQLVRQAMAATAEREAQQRRQWAENAQRIDKLWAQCVPLVPGDPVTLYLAHRLQCDVWPLPECLRLHPALLYRIEGATAGTWPAMVARLSAPDGRLLALHRTWLTREGRKAQTPGPCKKLTPTAGHLAGVCVRLGRPEAGQMGIAEGIETALAARCASGIPTVAAYSAGALAGWLWPSELRRLVIFADADPAGSEAADKLRQRARAAGLSVEVMTPTTPGADWCDVWANRESTEATA
jgi:putative DNA primase/helicase